MRSFVFFLCFVFVGLTGCKSTRPVERTNTTVKDSTWVETTYHKRDTVIFVPGDTTRIRVPVTEITKVPIRQTNGRTTAIVKRVGDNIDVQCVTDALQEKLEWLETIVKKNSVKERIVETTVEVPVRYTPWHVKILSWVGGIALLVIGGFVVIKFLKPI